MRFILTVLLLTLAGLQYGCTMESSSPDSSIEMDQKRALADPMNFTPDMSNTDVSGGGTANFDKKAFGRDLDDTIGR